MDVNEVNKRSFEYNNIDQGYQIYIKQIEKSQIENEYNQLLLIKNASKQSQIDTHQKDRMDFAMFQR